MKRLLVALVIIVTVVAVCIISLNLQTSSIDYLINMIDKMQQSYDRGDLGTCQEVSYNFVKEYEQRTRFFPYFMHHSDLSKVEESIVVLPAWLETGNAEEFAVALVKCRNQLELFSRLEAPIPENIF